MLRVIAILVLAGAAGAINVARLGLRWTPEMSAGEYAERLDRIAWITEHRGLTLAEFRARLGDGAAVIDVREPELFIESHLHAETLGSPVPALNILAETASENLARLHGLLQFTDTLVLYCNSIDCDYAKELYIELEKLGFVQAGFPDVRVYLDGWEGILAAQLPVAAGADSWQPEPDASFQPSSEGADGESEGPPASSDGSEPVDDVLPDHPDEPAVDPEAQPSGSP